MIVFEVKIHYADKPIATVEATHVVTATDDVKARGRALYLENKRIKGKRADTRPVIRFCEITASRNRANDHRT